MRATTEEKSKAVETLTVEAHAGYKAAKARMADIGAQKVAVEDELRTAQTEMARFEAERLESAALSLTLGKKVDDSSLRAMRKVEDVRDRLKVVTRAIELQRKVVEEMYDAACAEIVEKLKPEYQQIERQYFVTLIELGKLAEAKSRWVEKMQAAGVQGKGGGLGFGDVTPFGSAIGHPSTQSEAVINWHLREALRRGVIRREEIPAAWKWVY